MGYFTADFASAGGHADNRGAPARPGHARRSSGRYPSANRLADLVRRTMQASTPPVERRMRPRYCPRPYLLTALSPELVFAPTQNLVRDRAGRSTSPSLSGRTIRRVQSPWYPARVTRRRAVLNGAPNTPRMVPMRQCGGGPTSGHKVATGRSAPCGIGCTPRVHPRSLYRGNRDSRSCPTHRHP